MSKEFFPKFFSGMGDIPENDRPVTRQPLLTVPLSSYTDDLPLKECHKPSRILGGGGLVWFCGFVFVYVFVFLDRVSGFEIAM